MKNEVHAASAPAQGAQEKVNSIEAIAQREREVRQDLGALVVLLTDILSEAERQGFPDPRIGRALRKLRGARYSLGSMRCEVKRLAHALEAEGSAQERAS